MDVVERTSSLAFSSHFTLPLLLILLHPREEIFLLLSHRVSMTD